MMNLLQTMLLNLGNDGLAKKWSAAKFAHYTGITADLAEFYLQDALRDGYISEVRGWWSVVGIRRYKFKVNPFAPANNPAAARRVPAAGGDRP